MRGILLTLKEELKCLDWESQKSGINLLHGVRSAYLGNAYLYQNLTKTTINFLKKTALYSDTLIINDPILSELMSWEKRGTGDISAFTLVATYALRLLELEDLFDTSLNPPICYLAPNVFLALGEEVAGPTDQFIHNHIVPAYAGKIFGRDFGCANEVIEYFRKYRNFTQFISDIKKSDVPFVNPDGSAVTEQEFLNIKQYYDDKYNDYFPIPEALFLLLRGRFSMSAYDLSVNGRYVTCYTTDFPGVWKNFVWLLNSDNNEILSASKKKPLSRDTLVLHTLANDRFSWIGNVPIDKIKAMREGGELQDMRSLLSNSIIEIESVSDEEFIEVAEEAQSRLQQAFRKHSNNIKDINKDYTKKYCIDLATIIVTGSFDIVSAMYPPLAQSIGYLSPKVFEGASLTRLLIDYLDKRNNLKALKRRPVGLLFDAWKQST